MEQICFLRLPPTYQLRYLVLDVDEDSNHGRSIILKVLSSKSQVSPGIIRDFNRIKLDIWKEMGYRAIVSNSACKWVSNAYLLYTPRLNTVYRNDFVFEVESYGSIAISYIVNSA